MTAVRVVLDSSALVAYATLRGMAAAELIAAVEEDGGASLVGIPAGCFIDAWGQLADDEREHLVRVATKIDGVSVILPMTGADTIEVAKLGLGVGHAVVECRARGAYLATYEPGRVREQLPGHRILDLGED